MENDEFGTNASKLPILWNWVDILLIALTSGVTILLGSFALAAYFPPATQAGQSPTLFYTVLLTSLEVIGLLLGVAIFALLRKGYRFEAIGLRPSNRIWLVWAVAAATVSVPLIGFVSLAIQMALGLPLENPQLEFLIPRDFSWSGALMMIMLGGFLVPLAEEIFFRGVFYRWMRQFSAPWVAIIASSAVFGILHGDIAVAGATFLMGIMLAWFYEKSGSLWPSILIHTANNAVKLAILYIIIALGIEIPPLV